MGQNYAAHRQLRPLQSFYNSYNRQAEFQVPPHAVFLPCSSAVFEVLLERWSFRQSGYQEKHPARHLFSVPLALPFLEVPSPLQDLQGLKQAKERRGEELALEHNKLSAVYGENEHSEA